MKQLTLTFTIPTPSELESAAASPLPLETQVASAIWSCLETMRAFSCESDGSWPVASGLLSPEVVAEVVRYFEETGNWRVEPQRDDCGIMDFASSSRYILVIRKAAGADGAAVTA